MPTTTARILQSHGLNANKSAILAREIGLTDDTEQPVIGSTVGGAKYLGTEEFLQVVTAVPAAIPILRRSQTIIECNTATAGADIALDIRNGAQVAGYTVKVCSVGSASKAVNVQYATGVIFVVPFMGTKEFVWSGTAWEPLDASQPVVILPLTSIPAGNVTYTLPVEPRLYTCFIPKAYLVASAGGPFALTITTGVAGKETIIIPLLVAGSTIAAGKELPVYVDSEGNVYSSYQRNGLGTGFDADTVDGVQGTSLWYSSSGTGGSDGNGGQPPAPKPNKTGYGTAGYFTGSDYASSGSVVSTPSATGIWKGFVTGYGLSTSLGDTFIIAGSSSSVATTIGANVRIIWELVTP